MSFASATLLSNSTPPRSRSRCGRSRFWARVAISRLNSSALVSVRLVPGTKRTVVRPASSDTWRGNAGVLDIKRSSV
jgi:hypothetical protein